MAAHRYGEHAKSTHRSPYNRNMCDTDTRKYEKLWVDAIVKDNVDLAQQLLNEHQDVISNIFLNRTYSYTNILKGHARSQCGLICSSYAPNNVLSLAAVYNAREILKVLMERQIPITAMTSHGNNYLHCLIAFASVGEEELEYEVLSSAQYIRSLLSDHEYKEILLAENKSGLRPLELASHLGCMAMFKFIFQSELVYMTIVEDMAFYSVQYYDITDYVTGNRFFKSPPYTMMFLEEHKMGQKAVCEVFLTDPMKTWFSAITFSNMPYIIIWCLLRMSFLLAFGLVMMLTDVIGEVGREMYNGSIPHNMSNNTYEYTGTIIDDTVEAEGKLLVYAIIYICIYSCCALFKDTISFFYKLLKFRRWHSKTINGTKSLAAYTQFYHFSQVCVLIGGFVNGLGVLGCYTSQNYDFSVLFFLDTMVIISVCASVWGILYFLQLIPVLNIYVIAIQRMLGGFASLCIIFIIFFTWFSFGFSLLNDDMPVDNFLYYDMFRIMLNMENYADRGHTVQFLHMIFIFVIVYLLLNILIAVFTSAYDYVIQHKEIIKQVQSLTVTMVTEPIAAALLAPLHNRLRQKYLVYRENKVYATKVIMMPRNSWFEFRKSQYRPYGKRK